MLQNFLYFLAGAMISYLIMLYSFSFVLRRTVKTIKTRLNKRRPALLARAKIHADHITAQHAVEVCHLKQLLTKVHAENSHYRAQLARLERQLTQKNREMSPFPQKKRRKSLFPLLHFFHKTPQDKQSKDLEEKRISLPEKKTHTRQSVTSEVASDAESFITELMRTGTSSPDTLSTQRNRILDISAEMLSTLLQQNQKFQEAFDKTSPETQKRLLGKRMMNGKT